MVQGTRTAKPRTSHSVQLEYLIQVQEIKPWPPTQSLRSLRAVLIQWEHGDRTSGSTNQVAPSISGDGEGRIEFNESFRLPVALMRDPSHKGKGGDAFLKNCIQFNLYELRREKAVKGQLLGTAVVDLAAYGAVKESLIVSTPLNCKRTYWNALQPLLFLKIQSVDRRRRNSLIREDSVDCSSYDSVSVLSEEYAEEAEGASITTESSGSSSPQTTRNAESHANLEGSGARSLSSDLSSDLTWLSKRICSHENNDHEIQAEDIQKVHLDSQTDECLVSSQCQDDENASSSPCREVLDTERSHSPRIGPTDDEIKEKLQLYVDEKSTTEEEEQHTEDSPLSALSHISTWGSSNVDRSKHGKSVRSSEDSKKALSDHKIEHLEDRIRTLEGELREAATAEISLYSVIAEHGSSMTKVHAPARRLSRFYSHASKQSSESRRSAAKSIVSGLVLVSKACGNDVPRLTFWLSNSIVLRVIMRKSFGDSKSPTAAGSTAFEAALVKVEAWIFSRIVESVWWQTFTPHMQSDNAEGIRSSMEAESNKSLRRMTSSIQQRGNFSMELWKMAFKDAYEKICPVRAGGHDCGCLPVLSRVVMEQLIGRLDVAMFNAILRESADEIPTDPVADPISDVEVLPVPAGEASFGAGAQLKNAIGNWSRWLTGLFGIDDGEDSDANGEIISKHSPSKCFGLLNALSDLMMLPKDLLLSPKVRKEVCPTFGSPVIARVLNSFVTDEFCPDPVPAVVLEALNSEDHLESEDSLIVNFPCAAAPVVYEQPPSDLILGELGSRSRLSRSWSSVLKKSQTSDDELDELDSPLHCILAGQEGWKESGSGLRYQLLRDVWMNCD